MADCQHDAGCKFEGDEMTEASRVQKMLTEQNEWIDRLKSQIMRLELDIVGYRVRNKQLEAALREMLEKCTWAKREKWCGSLDCHCQIARKALEGKDAPQEPV